MKSLSDPFAEASLSGHLAWDLLTPELRFRHTASHTPTYIDIIYTYNIYNVLQSLGLRKDNMAAAGEANLYLPNHIIPFRDYQLAFLTPGIKPFEAISRNWIRLIPN